MARDMTRLASPERHLRRATPVKAAIPKQYSPRHDGVNSKDRPPGGSRPPFVPAARGRGGAAVGEAAASLRCTACSLARSRAWR